MNLILIYRTFLLFLDLRVGQEQEDKIYAKYKKYSELSGTAPLNLEERLLGTKNSSSQIYSCKINPANQLLWCFYATVLSW